MRPKLKLQLALYEQQKVGPLLVVASAISGLNDLKNKINDITTLITST